MEKVQKLDFTSTELLPPKKFSMKNLSPLTLKIIEGHADNLAAAVKASFEAEVEKAK